MVQSRRDDVRSLGFVMMELMEPSTRKIAPFRNDYVVSIIETYFDSEDMVIIYEHMDISLRNLTSILQGPFKPFHIAAICKEVSSNFNRTSPNMADPKIACM